MLNMTNMNAVVLLLIALLFTPSAWAQGAYTFFDINVDFPSFKEHLVGCGATALNDVREIVGACADLDVNLNSETRGFLYDGRRFNEIDFQHVHVTEPLFTSLQSAYQNHDTTKQIVRGTTPRGINNQGHIAGWYFDFNTFSVHGFIKRNGYVTSLMVPDSSFTEATGINDADQIVGIYRSEAVVHGFKYANGQYTSIDVPGAVDTGALGINNRGQIVGCHSLCSHGFLFDSETGIYTGIDVLGAFYTEARDINDAGQIVGVYGNTTGRHSFIYDDGQFTNVDVPGAVTSLYGINNLGQLAGIFLKEILPGLFESHAFWATRN